MQNKIGFRTKSNKHKIIMQPVPTEKTELEDTLKEIGFKKAYDLIKEYLLVGETAAHGYYGKQLYEIKKRFFEPI